MNIHVKIFMCIYIFSSLGCISRNGIARSCGNSFFSFLRNLKGILQSNYMKVIHPLQLLCSFLILVNEICYLIVLLTCISLMANDIEHLFMCLLAFFFLTIPWSLQYLSSLTRDWTQASAVKALNSNHWTTREFPVGHLYIFFIEMSVQILCPF